MRAGRRAHRRHRALQHLLLRCVSNLPYKVPAIEYHGKLVYSNRAPCGTVRGQEIVLAQYVWTPCWALWLKTSASTRWRSGPSMRYQQLDDRQRHCGRRIGSPRVHREIGQTIGWKESRKSRPKGRGIGFSCASHPSGVRLGGHFGSSVLLKLQEDGKVFVTHGGTEIGQGCNTIFCQMAAEVLGIPFEDVIQGASDSDTAILDSGMFSDRCTYWDGNATIAAANDLKRQLAEIAAKELKVNPEDLEFKNSMIL